MNTNMKWAMGGFGLAAMLAAGLAMGPLTPPAGPVADTEPSLADLEAKIDGIVGASGDVGDWQIAFIADRDDLDQFNAVRLAPGRVEVRSTTAYQGALALFDGPGGTIDGTGIPLNPANAIHFNYSFWESGARRAPSQLQVSSVVDNGLYIGYVTFRPDSVMQVEYRVLD
ncbi:MAG: hypothetical protein AAGI53_07765 [Planctomycetota bacterium]